MTDASRAAALWATVENALIRRGLIHDGRDLREQRADLVRAIGEAIGVAGVTPLPAIEPDTSYPTPAIVRAPRVERISVRAAPRRQALERTPLAPPRSPRRTAADGEMSRMLDRFLDASCKAGGYSGDDEVEYS